MIEARKELQNGLSDTGYLGIVLTRLNIGKVKEQGELAKAAEAFAKEKKQIEGEIIELDHVRARMKEFTDDTDLTSREARDVVQTERGKVQRNVHEIVGINLGDFGRSLGEALGGSQKRRGERRRGKKRRGKKRRGERRRGR